MKKVLVAAMAVALAAAMCVPASAFENEFGGYWRTRAYTQQDFSGSDNEVQDLQQVDTRTRLYYTAKFSDDFKFVNKFEFNSVWGDDNGGDVGADGDNFKVKNSYIDYNLGNYNFKIGTQGAVLARGLIMDDDFSGAVITGTFGGVTVPFYWIKNVEGGEGPDYNDADADTIVIAPEFKTGNMKINPYLVYSYIKESNDKYEVKTIDKFLPAGVKDVHAANFGVDIDVALNENANLWFTGIYQYGQAEYNDVDYDLSSYLVALGGKIGLGEIGLHGEFFYASGDEDGTADGDFDAFVDITQGQSYYWSEIMGYGLIDNQVSNNSCADKISNIMALNIGASMSPMDKLTVGADIWYAMLAEDEVVNGSKEDYLGTELDLSASYEVMDNLTLDVVAAYLFAGDATGDEDPMQLAAQLSFSF
ncbi:MAG: hypothetical protein AB7E04_05300 [Desulfobacteraceae bacterium]|jgi:hypothetical protein